MSLLTQHAQVVSNQFDAWALSGHCANLPMDSTSGVGTPESQTPSQPDAISEGDVGMPCIPRPRDWPSVLKLGGGKNGDHMTWKIGPNLSRPKA